MSVIGLIFISAALALAAITTAIFLNYKKISNPAVGYLGMILAAVCMILAVVGIWIFGAF